MPQSKTTPRSVIDLARRGVLFELRLYLSLARWIARRPSIPDGTPFGYARLVTPVMALWIFGSAVEIPIAHLLIPWDGVRIAALVLGVWGVLWMVGFLAGLNVYPHLLTDTGLRVRHGATVDITIAWDDIERLVVKRRDLPSSMRTLQPRETDDGLNLQVAVSGEVNVHAVLRRPVTVTTSKGRFDTTTLSFMADDPHDLVAHARKHVAAAAG